MALANFRSMSIQSTLFRSVSGMVGPKYWVTGLAFLATYLSFNILTEWHEFDLLGITIWSPDNGLSLALLTESAAFAPFVFLGAIITDWFIAGVRHSVGVTAATELLLAILYVILASILQFKLRFDIRQINVTHVVTLLVFAPVAAVSSSSLYCVMLYFGDALSSENFSAALRQFWIGDTLGIITVVPAVTSVLGILSKPRWRWSRHTLSTVSVFALGTLLGFVVLVGIGDRLYYLFNLLFLPIIWMGIREGYTGVALALMIVQLVLAVITVFMGYSIDDFAILQLLMLVLSITGLLIGAIATERRNAALLLREQQTELAEIAAYAKAGAMGTALVHEIGQPLSTVATYLHAARRLLQSGVASERVKDALVKAEAECRRAREVLENVRDFVSTGTLDFRLSTWRWSPKGSQPFIGRRQPRATLSRHRESHPNTSD